MTPTCSLLRLGVGCRVAGGEFKTDHKDEWQLWVASDSNRDAAVGKDELIA